MISSVFLVYVVSIWYVMIRLRESLLLLLGCIWMSQTTKHGWDGAFDTKLATGDTNSERLAILLKPHVCMKEHMFLGRQVTHLIAFHDLL